MSIDEKTVDHVALLARLALSDAERTQLKEQLSTILGHINSIAEADTSAVPATAYILSLQNVMAPDAARPCDTPEALLANAPAQEDHYFRVRAVLEDE